MFDTDSRGISPPILEPNPSTKTQTLLQHHASKNKFWWLRPAEFAPQKGAKNQKKTPVAATMLQNFKLGGKPNRTKPNRTESSGTKRSGSDKPHTKSSQQNVDSLTNRRPTGNGEGFAPP